MDTSRDALFTISELEYVTGFFFFQVSQRIHILYDQDGKQQSTPCQVTSDDIEHIALLNTCMHRVYDNILHKLQVITHDLKHPRTIIQQKDSNVEESAQLANEPSNGTPTVARCASNYADWLSKQCLPWIEEHDKDHYLRLLPKAERESRQLCDFYKNNGYPITKSFKNYDPSSAYSGIYSSLMGIQEAGKKTREKLSKTPKAAPKRKAKKVLPPVYQAVQSKAMLPAYRAIQPKPAPDILQANFVSQAKVTKPSKRKKGEGVTTLPASKKLSSLINSKEKVEAGNYQHQILSTFIKSIEAYSASLITACYEYIEYLKKYEQQPLCIEENVAQGFQLTTTEAPLEDLTTAPSWVNTEVQCLASAEDSQTTTTPELNSPAALSMEWNRLSQQVHEAAKKKAITAIPSTIFSCASSCGHPR